jgi:hypothetical protein
VPLKVLESGEERLRTIAQKAFTERQEALRKLERERAEHRVAIEKLRMRLRRLKGALEGKGLGEWSRANPEAASDLALVRRVSGARVRGEADSHRRGS